MREVVHYITEDGKEFATAEEARLVEARTALAEATRDLLSDEDPNMALAIYDLLIAARTDGEHRDQQLHMALGEHIAASEAWEKFKKEYELGELREAMNQTNLVQAVPPANPIHSADPKA